MPEVIFPGPEGRLEGRYHPQKQKDAPIAIMLHPHPQFGGTMNNRVVYNLHYAFYNIGFTVLRFNFRGVGRSQGEYDQGIGELSDAASALDYLQSMNQNAKHCWVAGFSFGAWIGMQLLMRRPEITGFISVSPPANMYDFSFLAPCPSSGLIINGTADRVAPPKDTRTLVGKLHEQKGITITHEEIEGAGHFFEDPHMEQMIGSVDRLRPPPPDRDEPLGMSLLEEMGDRLARKAIEAENQFSDPTIPDEHRQGDRRHLDDASRGLSDRAADPPRRQPRRQAA